MKADLNMSKEKSKSASSYVVTLALGSRPRQGLARLQAKKRSSGVKENVREWILTLPKELPPWELKFRWTLEFSTSNCRGQKPMDWRVIYIIGNLLKLRCLKWACMTHLDIWNISCGQKKGWESNWQFDFQQLKVKNRPDLLVCRWRATYHWKALDKLYNFALDLISIRGLHPKLWAPKVVGVPTLEISGLPLWDKMPFGCGPCGEEQSIL